MSAQGMSTNLPQLETCPRHDVFISAEDEQFREEKGVIIKEISTLEAPPAVQGQIPEATRHMF